MGLVVLAAVALSCGKSPRHDRARGPAPLSNRSEASAPDCTIGIDTEAGTVSLNGNAVSDYRSENVQVALGEPDRVEEVASERRYEEYGGAGLPPSSELITVTDFHHVYDDLGLVFHTRRGPHDPVRTPTRLLVFFAGKRLFDNPEPPTVTPRERGRCAMTINGHPVEPDASATGAGVDYRTESFERYGTRFQPTSIAGEIDSLYNYDGRPLVRIYLVDAATGQPALAEIDLLL